MSRYSIPSTTNPAHTIHYGFDRPLQEFFVQVTTTELDESNPGRSADLILMLGTENVLFPDPKNPSKLNYSTNDLIDLIKDYGGILPEQPSWMSIKERYEALTDAYYKKFGSPDVRNEEFEYPFELGDGHEATAIRSDKTDIHSIWIGYENGNYQVAITKFMQVSLTCENAINMRIRAKEKENSLFD